MSTHIEAEKDEDLRRKLKSQLVLFKYHLLKDIGDIEAVLKHIDSNRPLFEFSFHLDALAELCEKQDVWEVHSSQIQTIFFQILEDQLMENSVANYNMQRRYMLAMLARTDRSQRADVLQALNSHKCATIENFVDFFQGIKPEQFLMVYLKMLSRYIKKYVTDQKDKFCSKNYLILCMDIFKALLVESTEEEKAALRPLVKDFVDRSVLFYKNTLTLADELRHLYLDDSYFRKLIVSAMDQILSKSDDQGMKCTLQYQRMLVGLVDVDLCARDDQACIDTVNDFLASFDMFEDAFYKDMKKIDVAKGDRLTNDNYLFAACEILRVSRYLLRYCRIDRTVRLLALSTV